MAPLTRRTGIALAGAALLVATLAGCGDDEPTAEGEPAPTAPGEVGGRAPTTTAPEGETTTSAPATTTATDAPPLEGTAVALTELVRLAEPSKLLGRPGSDLLYASELAGRVVALRVDGDAATEEATVLDLTDTTASGGERGLLGLAFSPDGATLYVHHSGPDGETLVAAYAMEGDVADPASRRELLRVEQPYPNHNGGELLVDDDGLLWIGLGDGGSAGDPEDRAQDPDVLLGKVLRIDPTAPSGDRPFGIPDDNPYAAGGGAPEIAVSGVRNPWRMRFDPATGDLWIADVGQDEVEEVDRLPAGQILGANLQWSAFEGTRRDDEGREVQGGRSVGPVFEVDHGDGWCSITGGPLVRGDAVPGLDGAYLFGDYCKPGLYALRLGPDGAVAETAVLEDSVTSVVSIDTDLDGRTYVVTQDGPIYRIDPA